MDAKSRKRLRSNRLPNNVSELLQDQSNANSNNVSSEQSNNEDSDSVGNSGKRGGSKRGKHLNQPISPKNQLIAESNQTNTQSIELQAIPAFSQTINRPRRSELDKLTEEFFTSPDNSTDLSHTALDPSINQIPEQPLSDPLDLEYEDESDVSSNDTNDQSSNQPIPQFMIRPAPDDLPLELAIANPFSSYYHRNTSHVSNELVNPSSLIQYDADNIPIHPQFSGPTRGYIAYFFWDHYRYLPLHRTGNQPIKPPFTYLAASVPTIYQSILDILSDVERVHRGVEVCPLINQQHPSTSNFNRIVKVVHPNPFNQAINLSLASKKPLPQTYETYLAINQANKTRLIDRSGIEYQINAARKDQLGLIDKVIERLNLCPLLLDVYAVQGTEKKLVVGAGPAVRAKYALINPVITQPSNGVKRDNVDDSLKQEADQTEKSINQTTSPIIDTPQVSSPTSHSSHSQYKCTCTPHMRRVKLGAAHHAAHRSVNQPVIKAQSPTSLVKIENDDQSSSPSTSLPPHQDNEPVTSSMDERSDDDQPATAANNQMLQNSLSDQSVESSMDTDNEEPIDHSINEANGVIEDPLIDHVKDEVTTDSVIKAEEHNDVLTNRSLSLTDSSLNLNPSISPSLSAQLNGQFNEKERLKLLNKIAALQKQLADTSNQLVTQSIMTTHWENEYKAEKDKNCKLWTRVVEVQRQIRQMSRPLTTALAGQGRL